MSMTKDADTLSEQADAHNGMTLILKSNAFRRSAEENDEEHASLAKKIAKRRTCKINVITFQNAAIVVLKKVSTANFRQRKLLIL